VTRRPKQAEIPIQRRIHRLYADMKANEPYAKGGEISITFRIGGTGEGVETNVNRQELRSYLTLFRQLISDDDPVFLPRILRLLPHHVDDAELRERLGRALDGWKAAQGFPSVFSEPMFGESGSGRGTARLYLNGYVFHSDPDLSDQWDALGEDQQRFFEHAFRQYEEKVRLVFIELKRVIDAAREGGKLRDEPLDLGTLGGRADPDSGPADEG
jgi:hypothetical protein